MKNFIWKSTTIRVLLLIVAVLFGTAIFQARPVQGAALPAETCVLDTLTNTRTCELWVTTGVISLPGWPGVPIWGYTDLDPALGGTAELPGPVLIANQGETLNIILHNGLTEATGLSMVGQPGLPDLTGIPAGGTDTYSFSGLVPGTFLYEAAMLPNAQHQMAMGLVGALIVRPQGQPAQAYSDASTAFQDETLVLITEMDPSLNFHPTPAAFDMRGYQPLMYLINGSAYPAVPDIGSTAGNTLLVRYINAGLQPHTMSSVGLDQRVIAKDGYPLAATRSVVALNIAPGQTQDALIGIPPTAAGKFALLDSNLFLHNSGLDGFGGMMAFINLGTTTPPPAGPVTTSVLLTPNPTNGMVDVVLSAVIPGATGAEYFIGAQGTSGLGTILTNVPGTDNWTATLLAADVNLLNSGDHSIYVHGTDGTNWGAFNFAVLHLDKMGPMTVGVTTSPNPTNGAVTVAISATADDTMAGNSNVTDAMYWIDDMMAPGTPMVVNPVAPVASLSAAIPASTMQALVEGRHTVHVNAQDSFGNWGMHGTQSLDVDKTGPEASLLSAVPSVLYSRTAVRVDVTLIDPSSTADLTLFPGVSSNIKKAEGFIDLVGAVGTGFPLTPRDGLFNELSETAYANIPLATINGLAEGVHTVYLRGQDASGNWGTIGSTMFTILPQLIFSDGFESGSTNAWASTTGAAAATGAAARSGAFGLGVNVTGPAFGYVTDESPLLEPVYKARFYFNPNGVLPVNNNSTGVTIFSGMDGSNAVIFQVQFRRQNTGGGTYQVRLSVQRSGGVSNTGWFTMTNAWHPVEISWASGTSTSASLYVDGVLKQTLSGLNTSAFKVASVNLGPSAGTLGNSASGVMFFDDFVSKRTLYIGP